MKVNGLFGNPVDRSPGCSMASGPNGASEDARRRGPVWGNEGSLPTNFSGEKAHSGYAAASLMSEPLTERSNLG